MKKYFLTLLAVIALLATIGISCSPAITKTIARGAIEVALAICIAENPGADEAALKSICQWTDELAPTVRDLLAAQRKGAKRYKMTQLGCPDSGSIIYLAGSYAGDAGIVRPLPDEDAGGDAAVSDAADDGRRFSGKKK